VDPSDEPNLDIIIHRIDFGVIETRCRIEFMLRTAGNDSDRGLGHTGLPLQVLWLMRRVDHGIVHGMYTKLIDSSTFVRHDWSSGQLIILIQVFGEGLGDHTDKYNAPAAPASLE